MQEHIEENRQHSALPKELFDDLAKRLKSGPLRATVELSSYRSNTTLIGNLTDLWRSVLNGKDYDFLSLVVTFAWIKKVYRTYPLEAVSTIQIFGYGENKDKFVTVYSR